MSNVISMADYRNKPKGKKAVWLSFTPLASMEELFNVSIRQKEEVINEIKALLVQHSKLTSPSHLQSLPFYQDREKAVVESLAVWNKIASLADQFGMEVVRSSTHEEVYYEIKNKG